MNRNRFLLSCLAVYVVYQVLSFLTHAVWLADTYGATASVWRPEAELMSKQWIMFVTSAVWSIFFCYIFIQGWENKGVGEGFRYGVIIGLFFGIPQAYENYMVLPIPYTLALSWFLAGMVTAVVCGLVVALVYKPAQA